MSRRVAPPPGLSEQEIGLSEQCLVAMEKAAVASGISPFDMIICDDRLSDLHMLSVLWRLCTHLPEATAFALLTEDAELQGRARELGAFTLLSPLTVGSFRAAACQDAERWAENDKGRTG